MVCDERGSGVVGCFSSCFDSMPRCKKLIFGVNQVVCAHVKDSIARGTIDLFVRARAQIDSELFYCGFSCVIMFLVDKFSRVEATARLEKSVINPSITDLFPLSLLGSCAFTISFPCSLALLSSRFRTVFLLLRKKIRHGSNLRF